MTVVQVREKDLDTQEVRTIIVEYDSDLVPSLLVHPSSLTYQGNMRQV